tara:strand:+ start:7292 stop:7972 length:681 start_codon:yes stop_codon:yes gene_type:complete
MYLEIKNKKFILPLLGIYFMNISFICAQESKDIPIYLSKSIYLKPEEVQYKKIDKDVTKKQYRLLQNSLVFRAYINKNIIDPSLQKSNSNLQIKNNKNIAGKYLYAFNLEEVPQILESHISQISSNNQKIALRPKKIDHFKVILDENDRVYFTDGSLLITFNNQVNFSEFASLNNLMLKKEYFDLNMGVYIHKEFSTLESKIDFLEEINLISDVQYNVIDPYKLPE